MSQNQYEFVYFDAKGKGNMIRVLLADQGIKYTYTQVLLTDWASVKATYPFGQLPVLIVNGGSSVVAQSHTIARYLARECGLLGSGGSLDQALVEMWVDQTLDIRTRFLAMLHSNYAAGLQPFLDSLSAQLAPFENRLALPQANGRVALDCLTLADYALFDLLFFLQALKADCLSQMPALKAFYASFADRPAIREYMGSAEFKSLRTTGSPHLK